LATTDRSAPTTLSGLPLEDVYRPEDVAGPYEDHLGDPGRYPYTRGIHPRMYRDRRWTMRMFAGFGSPEQTNARFRYLIAQGQTGLSTAFDMPTLMGYDPDHPLSEGEVGREGVSVASKEDMGRLFHGIALDEVSTSMTISGPAVVGMALFIAAAEDQGAARADLRGTIQTDILKEYVAQKEWVVPERPGMRLVGDLVEFCTNELPLWHPVSISGYHIREAGATAVQELAFTIAAGLAYVDEGISRGLDLNAFGKRLSFFWNCHSDFFEEIAKHRAARRIWARLMKERGATDPRALQLRSHTQTSGVSLTAQQPLNNVARVAIQALAAVLGGTQSLHTNSFDETYAIPSEPAALVALRTQQIIADETGAADVVDPLGGSYFVEALTDRVEADAVAYLDEIAARGGMVSAVEQGYPQAEIAEAAYDFQRQLERGERVMVGINRHQVDEDAQPEVHQHDQAVELLQIERVRSLREHRDAGRWQRAMDEVRTACREGANVMPPLIAAAHAGATLGECCDVFREVFGVYRDPAVV